MSFRVSSNGLRCTHKGLKEASTGHSCTWCKKECMENILKNLMVTNHNSKTHLSKNFGPHHRVNLQEVRQSFPDWHQFQHFEFLRPRRHSLQKRLLGPAAVSSKQKHSHCGSLQRLPSAWIDYKCYSHCMKCGGWKKTSKNINTCWLLDYLTACCEKCACSHDNLFMGVGVVMLGCGNQGCRIALCLFERIPPSEAWGHTNRFSSMLIKWCTSFTSASSLPWKMTRPSWNADCA